MKINCAGWRRDAEIRWECDLLRRLRERGAMVSVPIPGVNGDPLQSIDGDHRQAVPFEPAAGRKHLPPFSLTQDRRQGDHAITVYLRAAVAALRQKAGATQLAG